MFPCLTVAILAFEKQKLLQFDLRTRQLQCPSNAAIHMYNTLLEFGETRQYTVHYQTIILKFVK